MRNLQRCPDCNKVPKIEVEAIGLDKEHIVFSCPEHGHMAMGSTVEMAAAHWNIYVLSYRKEEVA